MPFLAPLAGAIGGMSAGTAAALGAGASVIGGLVQGNATSKAQQSQNQTNERLAAMQSLDAWKNYLISRGVDPSNVTRVGQIPDGADAVNTLLPLWAEIDGQAAEPALFQQLLAASQANGVEIPAEYQELIGRVNETARGIFGGDFNAGQYLLDNTDVAGAFENGFSKDDQGRAMVVINGETIPMTREQFAQYHYENYGRAEGRDGSYINSMLQEEMNALQPVLDARTGLAGLEQNRIDEARAASENILSTELAGLDELLGVREAGANNIYGATSTAANDLFKARTEGAQSIYDADLTAADAYEQASLQALQKVLANQEAERARKGFAGGSSGDALLRARTTADAFTGSAGQRSAAGQNFAVRNAAAGEGRAGDLGQALIMLQQQLAGAREAGATGRLNANVGNATRQSNFLDADADIAAATAELQNAMDQLGVLRTDQNRRTGFLNLPGDLFQRDVALGKLADDQRYNDIDSILGRLGSFTIGTSTPPTPVVPNITTPISSGQIAGGLLSGLGNSAFDYFSTRDLINQLGRSGGLTFGSTPSGGTTITSGGYNPGRATTIPGFNG